MDIKNAKVVYIDDNKFNIALIKAFAEEFGINLITFLDAKEGLDYVLNNEVDLILLDYMMPGMNGLEFAKIVKEKKPFITIIMISAFDDYKVRAEAKKIGIDDFLPKPVDLEIFKKKIVERLEKMEKNFEDKSSSDKSSLRVSDGENIYSIFGKICVTKDKTYKNILNIANIAKIIALSIKDKEFADKIYKAAFFYDIGKNQIPTELLLKPSKLTKEEFELIKTHTILGYEMLNEKDEILQMASIMALNHHEKFNGSGYPKGLKEKEIPLCARIVAIADVFDALVSKKSYKEALSFKEATNIILKEKGKSFDPELVDIFYNNLEKIKLLYI